MFTTIPVLAIVTVWSCSQQPSGGGQAAAGTGRAGEPARQGLARIADNPLDAMPATGISPRFVIEHRSALNGRVVKVRGTVTRVVQPRDSPSAGASVTPLPGQFPQPRVFLGESTGERDRTYDLMVLLREGDTEFKPGDVIEIEGTVEGNQDAVLLRRRYPNR
jgi:hypothetical protein